MRGSGTDDLARLEPRLSPLRPGLTSVLAAGAVNDILLAGFDALIAKSNELEQRTGGSG